MNEGRATGEAVARLHEAAMIAQDQLEDPKRAAQLLAKASALHPHDLFLRRARLGASRRAGDLEAVRAEADQLLAAGDLPVAALTPLLHDVALAARGKDDDAAYESLARALDRLPGSPALRATRDAWFLQDLDDPKRLSQWVDALEAQARSASPEQGAEAWWRAAILASRRLNDFGRARKAYEAACLGIADATVVLRDFYEEALHHGDSEAALSALEALLARELEPAERSALLSDRVRLHEASGDRDAGLAALVTALEDPAAQHWAPMGARVAAAERGDLALLARAHRSLAELTTDDVASASHFAASARASTRAGEHDTATAALRAALERDPGHRYATALLEEILRAQGKGDEVVQLLRSAADAQAGPRAAMVSLLLAGAAAEASGDLQLAIDTYEQAAERDPSSVSPLHALARLARRQGDDPLWLRAQEALSQRELSGDADLAGGAGFATLDLGEHYLFFAEQPATAEAPLRQAMGSSAVALEAAVALILGREDSLDPAVRLEALERVMTLLPDAAEELRRDHGTTAGIGGVDSSAAEADLRSFEDEEGDTDNRWARLMRLWLAHPDNRADAYLELSRATDDERGRSALLLHSLRAAVVAGGADAMEDAFLLAQELAADSDQEAIGPEAAVALDETLQPGDDAESRAAALVARVAHASPQTRSALRAAAGRALSEARRPEAVTFLRSTVREDATDLASWEALRVAGREAGSWDDVVEACDVLAAATDGETQAELLEESAAVLMDHLGSDAEAERRLRKVNDEHPHRPNAYFRLHDLLAERSDSEALLQLVLRRIDNVDDGPQLESLFYEVARLYRARGQLDEALAALENLELLDPEHVGGLALAVEIHVSQEHWEEAVRTLHALANADVPDKQKRVALLGAANFLDKKLDAPERALETLDRLVALSLADASVHARRGDLAERAGAHEVAAEALMNAADLSTGPTRGGYLRHAGALLHRVEDPEGALLAYRQALGVDPIDAEAANAVAQLLDDPRMRAAHGEGYEQALRTVLRAQPVDTDMLRELMHAAQWQGAHVLQNATREALVALDAATREEAAGEEESTAIISIRPKRPLGAEDLAQLRAKGVDAAWLEVAELTEELFDAADHVEPSRFGVTRSDLLSSRKPHDVRDKVFQVAHAFGVEPAEMYFGGSDPRALETLRSRRDRVDFVLGSAFSTLPLPPRLVFVLGQQLMACRLHSRMVLRHSEAEATALLVAAASAAGVTLPGSHPPGAQSQVQSLGRAISRRARKGIAQLEARLGDVSTVQAHVRGVRKTLARAGLLASLDLRSALHTLVGSEPDVATVRDVPEAADVLAFWTSPELLSLRTELGLT